MPDSSVRADLETIHFLPFVKASIEPSVEEASYNGCICR